MARWGYERPPERMAGWWVKWQGERWTSGEEILDATFREHCVLYNQRTEELENSLNFGRLVNKTPCIFGGDFVSCVSDVWLRHMGSCVVVDDVDTTVLLSPNRG